MEVRDKIEFLPQNPGVYRYLDSEGTIIYVGKAKNLKKEFLNISDRLNPSIARLELWSRKSQIWSIP